MDGQRAGGGQFRRPERSSNISGLASGSLVATGTNTGSKGPVPVCSHHVYGGYRTLLPLFGLIWCLYRRLIV